MGRGRLYIRPVVEGGPDRPLGALDLAGGPLWFDRVDAAERGTGWRRLHVSELGSEALRAWTAPRQPIAGLSLARPQVMGILNVTPDSFSDGGLWQDPGAAIARAAQMIEEGADLLDIGAESTRPGSTELAEEAEWQRLQRVLEGCAALPVPVSVDTRKAAIAGRAVAAGAAMINDVSALRFDPAMAATVATSGVPVCLMHAQGSPETMQHDPHYADVLLDVFDALADRVAAAEAAGIPRARLVVDPGLGFGKTLEHNLTLLRGLSLFHGLGCAILVGASRKRFIGHIANVPDARGRGPGSVAVAVLAAAQGAQILRVHDVAETAQALAVAAAVTGRPAQAEAERTCR